LMKRNAKRLINRNCFSNKIEKQSKNLGQTNLAHAFSVHIILFCCYSWNLCENEWLE
jgi:hypothetical protein